MQMLGELKARTTGCVLAYSLLYLRVQAHMVESMHQANYRYTGTDVQFLTLEIAVLNPSSKLYIIIANWYMPVILKKPRVYCL